MCKNCKKVEVTVEKAQQIKGDKELVQEFIDHYKPMFKHHSFEVISCGLLEILRERTFEESNAQAPEGTVTRDQEVRILLSGNVGCELFFTQLENYNGSLIPKHVAIKLAQQEAAKAVIN